MKIQLVTPVPPGFNNGNKITAVRLSRILRGLGHKVSVEQKYSGKPCDILIALHARRSHNSIKTFHQLHPGLPLVVMLTGTDLYNDIKTDPDAQRFPGNGEPAWWCCKHWRLTNCRNRCTQKLA